jgi:hypothetical protein
MDVLINMMLKYEYLARRTALWSSFAVSAISGRICETLQLHMICKIIHVKKREICNVRGWGAQFNERM